MEQQLVKNFSDKMVSKLELRHDRYSELGWKTLDMKRILWLLEGEINELRDALKDHDSGNALNVLMNRINSKDVVRDCAIDIANYALFIYEKTN